MDKEEREMAKKSLSIPFENRKNYYKGRLLYIFEEVEKVLEPKLAAKKEKAHKAFMKSLDEICEEEKRAKIEKENGTYKWYNYCDLSAEEIEEEKRREKEEEEEERKEREEEQQPQEVNEKEENNKITTETAFEEYEKKERRIETFVKLVAIPKQIILNLFFFLLFINSRIILEIYKTYSMLSYICNLKNEKRCSMEKIQRKRRRNWDLNQWMALTI